MKITIDIPDKDIEHLKREAMDIDMTLEEYLSFLILKSWL